MIRPIMRGIGAIICRELLVDTAAPREGIVYGIKTNRL